MQCILMESGDTEGIQKYEFMCTNICPQELVVTIYVQMRNIKEKQPGSPSICGISLPNKYFVN